MLTDLARSLVTRGFEVHVICSRQMYDEPGRDLLGEETLGGVDIHRVTTTRFGRRRLTGRAMDYASFYVACAFMLLKLLRHHDVLIAKTDPPLLSLLAAPIAGLKGVKLINWQQDIFPEVASRLGANPLPKLVDGLLRVLRDASLRTATVNVVIGGRMREYLLARGLPDAKLDVIENWADAGLIQPKAVNASALRMSLDLAERFVVCYSGNLGLAHEFETLLGAAEELAGETTFVFLIIGNGAKMDALRKGVTGRGLENFRFLPYQPRDTLEDSLAAADVHLVSLLPALEGLIVPSKLYGILAAGRPLVFIGDPDGEIARVIHGARCGRVVAVGESQTLARSLRELAADSDGRASMGMRARNLLCEKFSLEKAIARWFALLQERISNTL